MLQVLQKVQKESWALQNFSTDAGPQTMGIRTVNKHDIALPHPFFPQQTSKCFHLLQQLAVCIFLLTQSNWRVPYDSRRITVAIPDMPIYAIVGR